MGQIDIEQSEEKAAGYANSGDVVARVTLLASLVAFIGVAAVLGYKTEQKKSAKPRTVLVDPTWAALPTAKPKANEQGKLVLDRKGILLDNGPAISMMTRRINEKDGRNKPNTVLKLLPPNKQGK